jgi:hypothetical protein
MKKIIILLLLVAGKMNAEQSLAGTYRGDYGEEKAFLTFLDDNRIKLSSISIARIGETGERISINDVKQGSYYISNNYGVSFIIFLWDNKAWNKYLMLTGAGMCILYQSDGEPFFKGWYWGKDEENGGWDRWGPYGSFYPPRHITASSSLREGSRIYSPANINGKTGEAWSEGVPGQGVGEYLTVKNIEPGDIGALYISIGYVSYSKPNLYFENSRPKRLRITADNEDFLYIDLKDTPDLQSILTRDLVKEYKYSSEFSAYVYDLKIEILEVYPGTKYTDTCINALFSVGMPP